MLFQAFLAKIINKFRWRTIQITDNRVRTMNEILNSIKLIKMYAWEGSFDEKITGGSAAIAVTAASLWDSTSAHCTFLCLRQT